MLLMIYITYLMKGRFAYEKRRSKVYNKRESSVILKRILVIAIPITIGAAISPILDATDVFIVVKRLTSIGFSKDVAATMYGRYSGLAMPLNVKQHEQEAEIISSAGMKDKVTVG